MPISSPKRKNLKQENLIVVILGAGRGSKMGNYGAKLNIVLPNNHTLLQHQLEIIHKQLNPSEIFVTIGYDADRMITKKPPGVRFLENNRWGETGEVEELRLVLNCCNPDRLLIMTGDIYSSINLSLDYSKSFSTSVFLGEDLNQIGVKSEDGLLSLFSFSFSSKFLGVVNLVGNELEYLRKLVSRERSKFALWELLEDYVKAGYKLKNIEFNTHKILKINSTRDLGIIRKSAGVL